MLVSAELKRDCSPEQASPNSVGFVPPTVTPPERFLSGIAAARAGLRNPVELWDRELFSRPSREMTRFGGRRFLEIADPALMHQVLVAEAGAFQRSEFQLRFTRPLVGGGILAAVGDNWKTQRRAAAPCFRHQAIQTLVPAAAAAGERAVRALRERRGTGDIVPVMMAATFDVVAELLGVEVGALDQRGVDAAADDYLKGVSLRAIADIFGCGRLHRALPLKSHRAVKKIREQAALAVTLAKTQTDRTRLLARLGEAFAQDSVDTADQLRDSVIAFIAAGNETSAIGLSWSLYLTANDPIVQSRLSEEARRVLGDDPITAEKVEALELHHRVIKEALRLFPPIALMQRTATRAVTIGQHQLNPGDEAVCAIYVMHRSERVWERPAVFDPERFLPEHSAGRHRLAFLPFGAGAHACLGMPLATMEMVVILASLTRSLRFEPGDTRDVLPVMRLTLRPDHGICLGASPRSREKARASCQAATVL